MSHNRYPYQAQPQNSFQYRPNSYRSQAQQNVKSYNPVQQPPSSSYQSAPMHTAPILFQRQASALKSNYPDTKWCAVYLNTKSDAIANNDMDMNVDFKATIPRTNTYLNMDIEHNIILEIEMSTDADLEDDQKIIKRKTERFALQEKAEYEKIQKIDTFMSVTSTTDRQRATSILKDCNWDLEQAAAKAFTSTTNVLEGGGSSNVSYGNNSVQKSTIRMVLPDNRQFTYQMNASDTFWGVYGRILQSVPDLGNKAFTFVLANGHVLTENEFDQNLQQVNLVPRGDIRIKY